jgi:NAD(P)H-dependent FMN reductase
MKLMIIWGSSRQGRKGGTVADWVKNESAKDSRFEVDFVDLRDLKLPFFDEPMGPFSMARAGKDYVNPLGRTWAQRVGKADGVILITPEYNHAPPAVLKNALDWVGPEWTDKPVGLISYGGISGGTRAVEQLRTITIELGLINVANAIAFPFFSQAFGEDGQPVHESSNESLKKMLGEIVRLRTSLAKN